MQTFLPAATLDFQESARLLDNKRLHKQALEAWQILLNLTELNPAGEHRTPAGWTNHPAVRMWRGHENALYRYILAMTDEWTARGYKTTIPDKALATITRARELGRATETAPPAWMLNQHLYNQVAATHRTALLVKDYHWYSQHDWPEDPGTPPESYDYLWPA